MKLASIFIIFLGSDGSGKSSVINNLSESIKILCPKGRLFKLHWRPGVLPQIRTLLGKSKLENELQAENPHSPTKRSRITSFLRWMYYSIDYIVGYYLKILPMKMRTTAVIMDRYYYDIIVDPVRYGFNLPQWLIKSMLPLIPKPDLTIYLDNKPEELYKRKQELPVEELNRQVKAWREFIPSLPNARIVTTDKPLKDVAHEVTKIVLERRAEMTRRMLKIEPEELQYLWKSDITDYIALPSKKNCRWIIPTNPKLAKKAWALYQPFSLMGRLYKNLMKLYLPIISSQSKKIIKENIYDTKTSDTLKKILIETLNRDDIVMAISTGTPSPFRKITGLVMTIKGNSLAYAKIGEKELAIQRIKNEAKVLKLIDNSSLLIGDGNRIKVHAPECLYEVEIGNAHILIQSPSPFEGKSGSSEFNEDYADVLGELTKNTAIKKKFTESEFCKQLKNDIDNYTLSFKELLKYGLNYLVKNIGDEDITFSLSHGDFAPWNMLWKDNEVFLYDWESADTEAPAGIDLLHFLFQTGFLLKKYRGKRLLEFYINEKPYQILSGKIEKPLLASKLLLLSYLLKMAVDEDREQLLSPSAVERRNLVKFIVHGS